MSSSILCPECKRKLTVPETLTGKSFRCPACKTIIPPTSKARAAASDPESDEAEAPRPSRAVKTAASARTAPAVVRRRPSPVEEPDEDIEADDEEPIRDKPRRKKRPIRKSSSSGLVIGLVVGGVVLLLLVLGIGGAVLWAVLRVRTISESEWHTFSPPGGDCTVLMPGDPFLQTRNIAGISAQHYKRERRKENATFELAFFDLPAPALPPNILGEMVKGARENLLAVTNGVVTSETAISLGNLPGRELQIKPQGQGIFIARVYLAKFGNIHRVYMVMAGGGHMQANKGDAARFFDSFKIDGSASPPSLDAAVGGGGIRPPAFNPPPANPRPNMPRPNNPGRRPRMPRRPL